MGMAAETATLEMGMEAVRAATGTVAAAMAMPEAGTPAKAPLARVAALEAIPLPASLPAATLLGKAAGVAIRMRVVVR